MYRRREQAAYWMYCSSQLPKAVPDKQTSSVTSSILNLTGHKDEALCRRLAEKLCQKPVAGVVSGHWRLPY